jgi:5-methylcytosine-specific restriction endonuclease McrA
MDDKYKAYLLSNEWKQIRIDLITIRGSKCEKCSKKTNRLQVHHLTYARIYNELAEDLILLCGICHQKAHGLIKDKPTKKKPIKKPKSKPKKTKSIWQIVNEAKQSKHPEKFVKAYIKASKRI